MFSNLLSYIAMQGGAFNVSAACAELASVGGQILVVFRFYFFCSSILRACADIAEVGGACLFFSFLWQIFFMAVGRCVSFLLFFFIQPQSVFFIFKESFLLYRKNKKYKKIRRGGEACAKHPCARANLHVSSSNGGGGCHTVNPVRAAPGAPQEPPGTHSQKCSLQTLHIASALGH